MSTEEKMELARLSPDLLVIAVVYTIYRSGVDRVEETVLFDLLQQGAKNLLKVEDWYVDAFAQRVLVKGTRKHEYVEDDPNRTWCFVIRTVEQGALVSERIDGEIYYRLSQNLLNELRDPETRTEFGLGEHIVLTGCYPARQWAKKQGKSDRGF